eukprot:945049-Pyramimonas_sp.AAC.1
MSDMLSIMGWDPVNITCPVSVSESSFRELIGNMMAVPVIGMILAALLAAVRTHQRLKEEGHDQSLSADFA